MEDARTVYIDIIDLKHRVSMKHRPMSREKRAAQFAPFAALNGFDEMIREAESEEEAAKDVFLC